MISRIDHVSLAVRDTEYDRAVHFFRDILGAVPGVGFDDEGMRFFWRIYSLGDLSRIELMKPTGEGSFLDNFLGDRNGGVHHITLETPDIEKAREILDGNGIPYFGFHDLGAIWKELFIHPKDAFGVLIQIAQFNPDDWVDDSVKLPPGRKFEVTKNDTGCILTVAHPGGGTARLKLSRDEMTMLAGELTDG
ncbi:MAG: VOC family protein [Deltaproteobacteria bacterium]|nr:VOC family protein [Deltaproteobacteria bacterium]